MSRLTAPWTPQQVAALNAYQTAGIMHPYTCGGVKLGRGRCRRVLVAITDGWRCPRRGCRYQQDWAHDWTAGEWLLEGDNR